MQGASGSFGLDIVARFDAPDHFAIWIADARDKTPIIYINDGRSIVYDPVYGNVFYVARGWFDVHVDSNNDDTFSPALAVAWTRERCVIDVDIKSLFSRKGTGDEVRTLRGGSTQFTRSLIGGTSLVALIDESRRCAFKRIEIRAPEPSSPSFTIRELSVNGDVHGQRPAEPAGDWLAGQIKLKDWSTHPSRVGQESDVTLVDFSLLGKSALRGGEAREKLCAAFPIEVDWEQAVARDRIVSRALRTALKLPDGMGPLEPNGTRSSQELRSEQGAR